MKYKGLLLVLTITTIMGAAMTFDTHRFLKAVAAREGGIFNWNQRGEYGPHQATTGIVRDWARDVKKIAFLDESAARDFLVDHYHEILYWHAMRLLSNNKLRARCATDRDLIMVAAQAWKYGVGGTLNGKGVHDPYMSDVANLYEANQ